MYVSEYFSVKKVDQDNNLYKLVAVEFWEYSKGKIPQKTNHHNLESLYKTGALYSCVQLEVIEKKIINHFKKSGKECNIMNPLYPDKGFTVLSVDVLEKNALIKNNNNNKSKVVYSKKIQRLLTLVNQRNKRLEYIFQSRQGDVSQSKYKDFYISNDPLLKELEIKLINNTPEVLKEIMQRYDHITQRLQLLEVLMWSSKTEDVIHFLINALGSDNAEELNLILLQLIPIYGRLSSTNVDRLIPILIYKTLLFPCSAVRNKTLALLSMIQNLKINDPQIFDFIELVSNTQQLNSSHPAKEIIKALKIKS